MADYIVKDTELTSVANAIRTAGGTNSLLSFPNGFVSAVENISGGGSSDFSTAKITFINTDNRQISFYFAFAESPDSPMYATGFYIDSESGVSTALDAVDVDASTSFIQEVYIQNDKSIFIQPTLATAGRIYTISGNVVETTYDDMPLFTITGDCTITIS